jgi:hypothetical protein
MCSLALSAYTAAGLGVTTPPRMNRADSRVDIASYAEISIEPSLHANAARP